MSLEQRYQWLFPVKDVFDRDRTLGIGVESGKVIVTAPTWFTFADPDLAEKAGYSLLSAAYVAKGGLVPQPGAGEQREVSG